MVLALQAVKPDILVVPVNQPRLRILLRHRVRNVLVNVQTVGILEELHIADGLDSYGILIIMALVLFHHFQTRILVPMLHEIGDFLR
ncbi:hypothetical protein D3C73_1506450 [compost metagenome]